jgi:peptidoglycan hydrolase CwlO-like protein
MRKILFLTLISISVLFPIHIFAQTNETTDQKEARLRAELAQVEKEQAETEKILADTKNQTASISRDILILNTKIKAAQLNIRAKNLLIESLGKDINNKQAKIEDLDGHINRGKETLAQIMRKNNELDTISFAEFILSKEDLTQVFIDVDNFDSVQQSLKVTFENIRSDKAQTQAEKDSLNKRKNQESDARAAIETEKKNIESNEKEKQRLLSISKSNEITYSQELAQKKAKAAQIKAALFSLRDSAAIPFGEALKYAQEAQRSTGIRPAFLLAILTQESALGKNVGSCYLTDTRTGAGVSIKSGTTFPNVMKPGRDIEPFLDITNALGKDPTKTLVSCPIPSAGGYGGAMGPAQFIASTWMLFKDRIASALSIKNPDPWNPEHAFMASSMFLTDLGAKAGSYTAERNAACRYYSGRACSGNVNTSYGNQVMLKADNIQRTMIDPLQGL